MKKSKNKTAATMIALFLALTIAFTLVALPVANAHTPPLTYPTFAYLAFSPTPAGVGQSVYVIMWVSPNPPTAMGLAGDRWRNMTVTVTKPNGDIEKLGPWDSDPTGSTFASYTPDQVGTYKFVFNYPGQVLSQTGPTGLTASTADLIGRGTYDFINDTFQASSATEYLTVQQEPIAKIPDYPLPTEYWTRPIEGENSAWASVASNWLGGAQIGATRNLWQAGLGPESPHIMWTKPIEFGGIVGNFTTVGISSYAIPDVGFYSGGAYEGRLAQPMIISGKLYFQMPLNHAGGSRSSGSGYVCIDLRTGEQIWLNEQLGVPYIGVFAPDRPLIKGQLFNYESQNQHGVVGGTIWSVLGSTWMAYDAWTGKWIYNLTKVPNGYETYTDTGAIVRYVLNYNATAKKGWLGLWNDTQHDVGLELAPTGTTTEAYQWRPMGKTVDMSKAYSWNVTITADLSGLGLPSILNAIPGDIILGTSTSFVRFFGTPNPYTIWAISDKPATRGQLLWIKNYSAPSGGVSRSFPGGNPVDTVNRVFFMQDVETFAWLAYSLDTGEPLWGPVVGATRAFSYYGSGMGGGQVGFTAYGNLYTQGYGGEICCFEGKTGKLLWKFNNTNSGEETVWGYYPIFIAAICDGKVYAFDNEHSPNYPLYKGEKIYCLNATTGEEIYSMLSWAGQIGGAGDSTSLLADGYLVYYNYYDNRVYSVGKGPSATTVEAPMTAIMAGDTAVIQGTVIDTAAGTKQSEQAARFPNGVAAVSDDSMSAWMEYVYMQKPYPANVNGVEITLDAVDPNNNFIHIGTATSDAYGTFGYAWTTPNVPGKYMIIATFAGSKSYYASYAQTYTFVSEAPAATPPPQYPVPIDYTLPIVGMGIAIIIAVAIVGILMLRKRP
jgi:hypothetical protein